MSDRLLLVEDDPNSLSALREFFSALGFEVTACEDPGQALAVTTPQDVLVTDWHLGTNQTGTDLARTLVSRWPGLRVVIMTAYPLAPVKEQLEGLNDPALLSKPLRFESLLSVISP